MALRPASSLPATRTTSLPPARRSNVLTIVNQNRRFVDTSRPSRRVPRQRESWRIGRAGLCPELQLRLLPAATLGRPDRSPISGGPSTWPKAAVDCEPQNAPAWCLFQMQSPDNIDATGNYYGAPLTFDRPVKAVFSSDGSTAYILSCGPECGGSSASHRHGPDRAHDLSSGPGVRACCPAIFPLFRLAPTPALHPWSISPFPAEPAMRWSIPPPCTSWASSRSVQGQTLFGGNLTVVNLANNTVRAALSPSATASPAPPAA